MDQALQEGELIVYRSVDWAVHVKGSYESETLWQDQRRMVELFGVDVRTVSYQLKDFCAVGR